MNILIPDSWLREYLETEATPKQLKEYLSLCGPSVERIRRENGETVYDIEVTGNRPDSMSVVGIAREAAAILPRFGIAAKFVNDPYLIDTHAFTKKHQQDGARTLAISTDSSLNPRWTSIVLSGVRVAPSPEWLQKKLALTGIRSINNVIDITNYIMRAYGQPAHAFDYDAVAKKNGKTAMILRASRKGEKLTTLDGKTHTLPGNDIIIEDGAGRLIDLCGIMGGENSGIKPTTTTVILFMQTYDPVHIRKTSMALAHRTEAAGLFEKGLDSELVLPAIVTGTQLMEKLTGGKPASKLYDYYESPYVPYDVSVTKDKLTSYIGDHLDSKTIEKSLTPLGFNVKVTTNEITVTVPSWRRDVSLDVDIIEEVARIFGYHEIKPMLPDNAPPMNIPEPELFNEQEVKTRLRDWGYTELYTYSMISGKQMDLFHPDIRKSYKIANPLSGDWEYMRPSLLPGVLAAIKENLSVTKTLRLFELSQTYQYRKNDLPQETPTLIVSCTGHRFFEAKGLAQAIFQIFGIPFPDNPGKTSTAPVLFDHDRFLGLDEFGEIGEVQPVVLASVGIHVPVTVIRLNMAEITKHAHPVPSYIPIPKYPPAVEDLAFTVPLTFSVGPLINALKNAHPLVYSVSLFDAHEDTRTFHIEYLDTRKNLTAEDTRPVREKLIAIAFKKFGIHLKTV